MNCHCTCDVSFPPEVLLDLGSEAGDEVVEVHDDVDPHVEEHEEGRVAAPHPLQEDPADQSQVNIRLCDRTPIEMSTELREISHFMKLKDL